MVVEDISFNPFTSPYASDRMPFHEPPLQPGVTPKKNDQPNISDIMAMPLNEAVRELKVRMLEDALAASKFRQKEAARRLGLTYHQFRGLYRQYKNRIED